MLYRVLPFVSLFGNATVYIPIVQASKTSLMSLTLTVMQLLSAVLFYMGGGMIVTSVYRYAEYRLKTKGDRVASILNLGLVGLCLIGLSFIEINQNINILNLSGSLR